MAVLALLVVALVWSTAAQAQSPADDQYGGPNVPSGPALGPSGVAVEGPAAPGSEPAASVLLGVLPATGGAALLIYAGVLVASGAGLVLLRRSGRDE